MSGGAAGGAAGVGGGGASASKRERDVQRGRLRLQKQYSNEFLHETAEQTPMAARKDSDEDEKRELAEYDISHRTHIVAASKHHMRMAPKSSVPVFLDIQPMDVVQVPTKDDPTNPWPVLGLIRARKVSLWCLLPRAKDYLAEFAKNMDLGSDLGFFGQYTACWMEGVKDNINDGSGENFAKMRWKHRFGQILEFYKEDDLRYGCIIVEVIEETGVRGNKTCLFLGDGEFYSGFRVIPFQLPDKQHDAPTDVGGMAVGVRCDQDDCLACTGDDSIERANTLSLKGDKAGRVRP